MAKNIITGLIKELKDLIMQKLLDYIISTLTPMILEIQKFIASEQIAAYMAVIRLLMAWFNKGVITLGRLNAILSSILSKFKDGNYEGEDYEVPSILDTVNYADIYKTDVSEEAPIINNC
jgi:acyl CoA:acetate/3-ketoacid CoA transferase